MLTEKRKTEIIHAMSDKHAIWLKISELLTREKRAEVESFWAGERTMYEAFFLWFIQGEDHDH